MTAPITSPPMQFDDAHIHSTDHALHLIGADGRVVYPSHPHSRAFCLAMVETLLWIMPEAVGWELVCLATGEPVMAGCRGEGY